VREQAAKVVLSAGYWLKVGWVYASVVSAQVIKIQAFWYRSVHVFVGGSV